ncbi:tripartite tricarboxylate transporter TctB family protein [Actibacterium pelagium]|uniref:DUF1468 domain-containing protein n=1 Tax=Actibacterium pelagium TaxID=2029103 RepID=A0A917EHR8_9RHOB|nr:tripartite tricarboxylate transporter TctB family protein [Actibacterium pelagium]GGE45506.1 hypothetical protein GCM10011517_11390 [Actibacterium pelagium]
MTYFTRDIWIGLVMLGVSIFYWLEASKIRVSPLDDPVGASGLPKSLAWALGALAILLIIRAISISLMTSSETVAKEDPQPLSERIRPHLRAIGMLALGVGYLLVVNTLGYVISIGLLIFFVSLYIGAPLSQRTILIALIGPFGFYLLFVLFLGIPLPGGTILPALPGTG